jgi:predicted transglutaminase-like cysteine proteinase
MGPPSRSGASSDAMKRLLTAGLAAAGAAWLAACLGPAVDAVVAPYREPTGRASSYEGMFNDQQQGHLRRGTFPRLSGTERQLLRRVNARVNRDIRFLSDWQNYGLPDRPVTEPPVGRPARAALPPARYGDCEDYALTKKQRLGRAGFSPSRSFVALAQVPEDDRRVMHTVLAVPEGSEWWILNNWDDDIQRASTLEDWWEWEFIRPRYDSYLLAAQMRRISGQAIETSGAGTPARTRD